MRELHLPGQADSGGHPSRVPPRQVRGSGGERRDLRDATARREATVRRDPQASARTPGIETRCERERGTVSRASGPRGQRRVARTRVVTGQRGTGMSERGAARAAATLFQFEGPRSGKFRPPQSAWQGDWEASSHRGARGDTPPREITMQRRHAERMHSKNKRGETAFKMAI